KAIAITTTTASWTKLRCDHMGGAKVLLPSSRPTRRTRQATHNTHPRPASRLRNAWPHRGLPTPTPANRDILPPMPEPIVSPIDGQVAYEFEYLDEAVAVATVERARAAQRAWKRTELSERADLC